MLKDLVLKARSYRKYQEDKPVAMDLLVDMVDMARQTPAGGNIQVLRYAISTSKEMNAKIFPNLAWAKLYTDWPGPEEGERPAAYIIIAGDQAYQALQKVDSGIAAQTIQLGLAEAGVGCCMLGSINAKAIHELVGFPEDVAVLLVLSIGYPGETVALEEAKDGNVAYWRTPDGVHHVPKRKLAEVLLKKFQ